MSASRTSPPPSCGRAAAYRQALAERQELGVFLDIGDEREHLLGGVRTRRALLNIGIGYVPFQPRLFWPMPLRRAGRAQPREILAGVVRGARQRRRGHHQEALHIGDRLEALELVRRDEADHRMMLARGLRDTGRW
jgi:hypothetical protein